MKEKRKGMKERLKAVTERESAIEKKGDPSRGTQWSRKSKNPDVCTGLHARPFTRIAHLLTHSFIPKLMGKFMTRCLKTAWFCPVVG